MLELQLRRMGFSGEEIGEMDVDRAGACLEAWKAMNEPKGKKDGMTTYKVKKK